MGLLHIRFKIEGSEQWSIRVWEIGSISGRVALATRVNMEYDTKNKLSG